MFYLASLCTTCVATVRWPTVVVEEEEEDSFQEEESEAPAQWWSSATAADRLKVFSFCFQSELLYRYTDSFLLSLALLGYFMPAAVLLGCASVLWIYIWHILRTFFNETVS